VPRGHGVSRRAVAELAAAAVAAAMAVAIPLGAAVTGPAMKAIPPASLEALHRSLQEVAGLVPAPGKPYVLDPEGPKLDIDPHAPWDPDVKTWTRPARATAESYYDVPEGARGTSAEQRDLLGPIEVTVELNGDPRLPGLASEGAPPAILRLKGALAVEISTVVPGPAQGRVASMTPRQSAYRLAALTIFIGDPTTEAGIVTAVRKGSPPRGGLGQTSNPAALRLICIRLHGPKKPIEELARGIPTASLRRLLRG